MEAQLARARGAQQEELLSQVRALQETLFVDLFDYVDLSLLPTLIPFLVTSNLSLSELPSSH